jgi:hypothetical protein
LSLKGQIECDYCRIRDKALDRGDGVPHPWYTLSYPNGSVILGPYHFCTLECLIRFLKESCMTNERDMRDIIIKLCAETITNNEGG